MVTSSLRNVGEKTVCVGNRKKPTVGRSHQARWVPKVRGVSALGCLSVSALLPSEARLARCQGCTGWSG